MAPAEGGRGGRPLEAAALLMLLPEVVQSCGVRGCMRKSLLLLPPLLGCEESPMVEVEADRETCS